MTPAAMMITEERGTFGRVLNVSRCILEAESAFLE